MTEATLRARIVEFTNRLVEAGITYIPIPVMNDNDLLLLTKEMEDRINEIIGEEPCQAN